MKKEHVHVFYESKLSDIGIMNYKISLFKSNGSLFGRRKNLINNEERILIGKKLNDKIIEFLEYNNDVWNVLYGHFDDNLIYGNWKLFDDLDWINLTSDNIILPDYVMKENFNNCDSKLIHNDIIEDYDKFMFEQQNLVNKLSFSEEKSYNYIKKNNK